MEQKGEKNLPLNKSENTRERIGMEIIFYTDPLCCWTWAMQSQWKLLLNNLQDYNPIVKYKMGGLLPSWNNFNDSVNAIRKPVQMGPEWMHARALSGAVINDLIWVTDPPASSFPACIAVKCAELQSSAMGARFLTLVQEAVMIKNLNISRTTILLQIASSLLTVYPDFDTRKFEKDLLGEQGKEAFRKDLQECKYLNINRLPTIVFKIPTKSSVSLTGYQSYESLISACKMLDS
jgi:putative protein-disulfide isomerase